VSWADRPDLNPGAYPRGDELEEVCDRIAASPLFRYKTVDLSRNNAGTGSTLTDDPELSIVVDPGKVYRLAFEPRHLAPVTPAIKYKIIVPPGSVIYAGGVWGLIAGTWSGNTWDETTTLVFTGGAASAPARAWGTLITGSFSGLVTVQWAQNTADAANTTLQRGSSLSLWEVS
jgi:hypothetical protein